MHDPIQRDQAQHIAVAQRPRAQRQLDVVAIRQLLLGRGSRRGQRHPPVTTHTPIPAQPVAGLTHEQLILRSDLRGVGADKLVPMHPQPISS
jgi:hypothetical protein